MCYFSGKITITGLDNLQRNAVGIGSGVSRIENCYNIGTLIVKTDGITEGKGGYLGGISNGADNGSANINNCYNIGTIEGYSPVNHLGGIDANAQNGNITNCCNKGNIIIVEGKRNISGSIVGTGKNLIINNSKWLLNTASSAVGSSQGNVTDNSECIYTLEEMPSVLSIINGDSAFKEDTNNINNGYPILEWQ